VKIEGEYLFNGPREEVWIIVRDPEVLATAILGTQSLELVSEGHYVGEMNVRIGPVAGIFSGRILVSKEVPPESCTLNVEGKGSPGFLNGAGNVLLYDQGDGTTLMKYDGDVQVGGKLASVGQRLLDTASKSIIRQGLEALNVALQARLATKAGQVEAEYKPPSESRFFAAVAKDMAGQLLSSRAVWIALGIIVLLAVVIAVLLSRGGGG
jgi:hypothetical protein